MTTPTSCDTFVALPPATADGCVVFGKNSDRPDNEVQEVVYFPESDHAAGSKVQCTYVEVDQVAHTHAVILSRPSWLWGAEMGSNEHGVCIGNEAVWTKVPSPRQEKLLGMDLVRLGLERSQSAKEAVNVITSLIHAHGQGGPWAESPSPDQKGSGHVGFLICDPSEVWVLETVEEHWAAELVTSTSILLFINVSSWLGLERGSTAKHAMDAMTQLLEQHGQGGACSEDGFMTYHNSFIICDCHEAWVLETTLEHWAAQKCSSGVRNISNQLTITTKIDAMSPGLKDFAQSNGYWGPDDGDFNFSKAFSDYYEDSESQPNRPPVGRQQWGHKLLTDLSQEGNFSAESMMKILRDERSGICMGGGGYCSTGSQVSVLSKSLPNVHWFTATPNPRLSLYKPFIFSDGCGIGINSTSPTFGDADPARVTPRFQSTVDRRHPLWKAHSKLIELLEKGDSRGEMTLEQMHQMEAHCLEDMKELVKNFDDKASARVQCIFQHMTDLELNFYM